MIKTQKRITMAVLAVIGLLCILLIPFTGGGLIPDDFEPQFFDMIDSFSDAADYAPTYMFATMYLLPLFILLASIFMLISALVGKKGLCVAAGATGLGLWFIPFIVFFADASDLGAEFDDMLEVLFDGDHGLIAIGVWIALILFIAYLCIACSAKKQGANNPYQAAGYQQYNPYQNGYQPNGYQPNGYQAPVQNTYADPNANAYAAPEAAPYAAPEAAPVEAAPYTYAEPTPAPETYADISSNATAPAEEIVEDTNATANVNAANKFCPECGAQAKADAMFCGSCGHKF